MVVWLSCYAWVPVVFLMAYDRAKGIFNNCCKKKKPVIKENENITKEEKDTFKLNEENKRINDDTKEKSEWIFYELKSTKEKKE